MPPPTASGSTPETLQHVSIKVGDNQQEIVFANLAIQEKMADTNQFNFTWKNDFNDDFTDDQEKFIQNYIGEKIIITLDGNHTFKGIILEINFQRNDGLTQEFNISGQGLAVKLLDHSQSASYYKKTLKDIITDSMRGIASNELSIDCDPKNTSEIFYTVQYNEPDFHFIYHLAVRHGEWFYYNGEKLKFGKLDDSPYEVNMGSDIFNARLSSSIRPMTINSASYNNFSGENISGQNQSPSSQGLLNSLSSASTETFDRSPTKSMHLPQSPTQASLDNQLSLETNARAAKLILFSASSRNANIKLGSTIKVVDGNKSSEYIITQIQHNCSTAESYSNHFSGVPASVQVPPYTNPNYNPRCDSQSAIVKENEDPDGHDRIKVHFPWQQSNEKTPWIRIQNPYAGKDKGFRFIPEVGEEVLIGFENGNAEKPYVIGAMYHAAASSGHNREGNHIKIFRSKSGSRFMMNDQDGSIKITDKAGSSILLDGAGNIKIIATKNILFEAGEDIESTIARNFKETIGGKYEETISGDKTSTSGGNESLTVGGSKSETVASNSDITVGANMKINGGANIELTAGAELKASGGVGAKIEGGATAEISSGMTTVKGSAMTTIKGGMVMIN
ncbi:MAG TPA: phage baseplate assembly protein V [Chitinophagaceae bacterium]|nr:phage baseplate assembly protein V [Chitinophagaceae bacterium]